MGEGGGSEKMYGANDKKVLNVNICVHLGGRNIEVVVNKVLSYISIKSIIHNHT